MNGKITFVGAGPGAVDLITLRGAAALDEAELVVYAGSLVNEKLLERAAKAELVNSAKLSLPEVIEIMAAACRAGKRVVRLHTGDPAIYGAVSEQFRELDRLGIPYEVVPGVSSAFAAAAELKVELTMPELSQSVILTRMAGRTPVPEKEALERLAEHGATLCIYLSAGDLDGLVEKLASAGLPPETPAAVVYRASWPNQKIVRGTLNDIAGRVREAGIKRQAMIVVGRVLGRDGALSKLYDESFSTGFRAARKSDGFRGRTAIFALTAAAAHKAAEIAAGLDEAMVILPEKHAGAVHAARLVTYPEGDFAGALGRAWNEYAGLAEIPEHLLAFGGHKQAAGVRILPGQLDAFRHDFEEMTRRRLGKQPEQMLAIDGELSLGEAANPEHLKELALMEPFGTGNAEPVFVSNPVEIVGRSTFRGRPDSVSLVIRDTVDGHTLRAKGWGLAQEIGQDRLHTVVRIAFTLRESHYSMNGPEITIRDWGPADKKIASEIPGQAPTVEDEEVGEDTDEIPS